MSTARLFRRARSGPAVGVQIHRGPGSDVDLGGVHVLLGVDVVGRWRTRPASIQVSFDGHRWSRALGPDEVDGVRARHLRALDVGREAVAVRVRPEHVDPIQPDKRVVSVRADGLGERLNGLLNAFRLGEVLGLAVSFAWPKALSGDPQHAIGEASDLFSAEFLDAHLDQSIVRDEHPLPTGPADDMESLERQLLRSAGLRVDNTTLRRRIDPRAVPALMRGFSTEFAGIGWHPSIAEAIDAAHRVDLGAATGIHLRAGDIIYGRYGTWNGYAIKCVSAPVARHLIERAASAGHRVVVFGQDDELVAELCRSTGALKAVDLRPAVPMSSTAAAMFDLVLLSRCSRIISGSSGFATQAASISDQRVDHALDVVPPREILEVTCRDLERHRSTYSPAQQAFALWLAYYVNRDALSFDEAAPLLRAAIEADPSNPRHRLRLAALTYREGDVPTGDDILRDALTDDLGRTGKALRSVDLFSLDTVQGLDSAELFDDFDRAIDAGSVVARLYRAALRERLARTAEAEADRDVFLRAAGADPRLAPVASRAASSLRHIRWKTAQ